MLEGVPLKKAGLAGKAGGEEELIRGGKGWFGRIAEFEVAGKKFSAELEETG